MKVVRFLLCFFFDEPSLNSSVENKTNCCLAFVHRSRLFWHNQSTLVGETIIFNRHNWGRAYLEIHCSSLRDLTHGRCGSPLSLWVNCTCHLFAAKLRWDSDLRFHCGLSRYISNRSFVPRNLSWRGNSFWSLLWAGRNQLNLSTRNLLQNTWAARANSELTGLGGQNNAKDI